MTFSTMLGDGRLLGQQGANDCNRAMARSAFYGHKSIVRLMLDRGADNYNETMINAKRTCHEAIVRLMLEKCTNDYNRAMVRAPVAQWVVHPTHIWLVLGSKHAWCKNPLLVFAMIAS